MYLCVISAPIFHVILFFFRIQVTEIRPIIVIENNRIGVIVMRQRDTIPFWEKRNLTLEEAAAYSGIGINKLRMLSDKEDCSFVLWVGRKRLIKRKKFDEYLDGVYSI